MNIGAWTFVAWPVSAAAAAAAAAVTTWPFAPVIPVVDTPLSFLDATRLYYLGSSNNSPTYSGLK